MEMLSGYEQAPPFANFRQGASRGTIDAPMLESAPLCTPHSCLPDEVACPRERPCLASHRTACRLPVVRNGFNGPSVRAYSASQAHDVHSLCPHSGSLLPHALPVRVRENVRPAYQKPGRRLRPRNRKAEELSKNFVTATWLGKSKVYLLFGAASRHLAVSP